MIPPIPGIETVAHYTNETVFSLTELPSRLLVVGAGPIGCELAQSFQRLGSQVTLLEMASQIMPREDADAASVVAHALVDEGVQLCLGATVKRIESSDSGVRAIVESNGGESEVVVDGILLGAGRAPNVDGMNLEAAGVRYDTKAGVEVDDFLRTSTPHIFACGDVCLTHKFTHTADAAARIVLRNALFPFLPKSRLSKLVVPWVTFTEPEVAHVGISESEAARGGIEIETIRLALADVDRAILEGATDGFLKVHLAKGSGRILGATLVSPHAGESIGELVLAMVQGTGIGKLSGVIHPYPTQAEAVRKAGDQFTRGKLTPFVLGMFRRLLAWQR